MGVIVGLALCLGSIYATMIMSGQNPGDYIDGPSALIVVGGSLGAALMSSKVSNMFKIPIFYIQALLPLSMKMGVIVVDLKRMADKARQGGLPALTSEIPVAPNPFVRRGLKLLTAGTDSKMVQMILEAELSSMEQRHEANTKFMDALGGYFPAFGMLGTVLGIVQAMGNIDDVGALGTALAIALMTTLYGVFGSNVVVLPISSKLKNKSSEEALMRAMYIDGFLAIQAGSTSKIVDQVMKAYVDEKMRQKIEGGKVGGKKVEKHIEYTTYMQAMDQEKAMAFMAEVEQEAKAKNLGQDDVKAMLADLINEADDGVMMKDFAAEYMKIKLVKKLPKGAKRKGKKKKKKKK